jgi:hypothetical protein
MGYEQLDGLSSRLRGGFLMEMGARKHRDFWVGWSIAKKAHR